VIWRYFTRKYSNKIDDLLLRIEDLVIEKYRSRRDIVVLLEKVGEYADEISKKEKTIRELEENVENFQRQIRQKRIRTENS
jgi:uncharacterized protein Yka (UPF0111/DUF47 family)